jgi:hypothetical protein
LNWAFTKESYAVARLLFRERNSLVEVRPGQTPAHSRPLIPYTTTRDTIRGQAAPLRIPHVTGLLRQISLVRHDITPTKSVTHRQTLSLEVNEGMLADRAYQGAGATVRTPYKNHREQPARYQEFNRDHARLRAPGERAFAQLKSWRLLRRARCSTRRIGTIVPAVHTLMTCSYSG